MLGVLRLFAYCDDDEGLVRGTSEQEHDLYISPLFCVPTMLSFPIGPNC